MPELGRNLASVVSRLPSNLPPPVRVVQPDLAQLAPPAPKPKKLPPPKLNKGVVPTQIQKDFADFVERNQGVGIAAHGVGQGKTLAGIMASMRLRQRGMGGKALAIVPAGLRDNFATNGVKKFTNASVGVIGTSTEIAKNRDMDVANMGDKDFYVISYDMFKKDPEKYLKATGADTIIADELHKAKDEDTAIHKTIQKVQPHIKNLIGLSVSGNEVVLIKKNGIITPRRIEDIAYEEEIESDEIANGYFGHVYAQFQGRSDWYPVYAVHKYRCEKRCFRIKTQYGYPVELTEDHSVFIWRNGEIACERGDRLAVGDLIVMPSKISVGKINDEIDIASQCKGHRFYAAHEQFASVIESKSKGYERYNRLHGALGPCLPLEELCEVPSDTKIYSHRSANRTWAPAKMKAMDVAWMLGYFVGDGWIDENRTCFAVANQDLDDFTDRIKKLPIQCHFDIRQIEGAVQFRVTCRALTQWLSQWFAGKYAWTKRLPPIVFSWSDEAKRLFVDGLIASDGHDSRRPKNRARAYYTTTSEELAWDIVYFLRTMGLYAGISKRKESRSPRDRSKICRPSYYVHWSIHEMNGTKVKVPSRGKFHAKRLGREGLSGIEIKSIEEIKLDHVYDLSVAGAENFFANMLLCHNTASPAMNDPFEAVSLINAISKKRMTPGQFQKEFYERKADGIKDWFFGLLGHQKHGPIVGIKNPDQLGRFVGAKYHFAPDIKDPSIPRAQIDVVRVPMSEEQTKLYKGVLQKQLTFRERRILEKGELLPEKVLGPIINKTMAARQLSNNVGFVKGELEPLKTPKVLSALTDVEHHLEKNPRGQVLLYSQFMDNGVDVMAQALKEAKIPYATFTGREASEVRDQAVKDYNAGKIKVLIISKAGSQGLNLPNTTMMGLLDGDYNPEMITQIQGRALRRGGLSYLPEKDRKVQIKRYVSIPDDDSMSVDEKLYDIAAKKAELIKMFRTTAERFQAKQEAERAKALASVKSRAHKGVKRAK